MKRILVVLFLLMGFTSSFATPFDRMAFFGDSLSDNGNLYKIFFKMLPHDPPYYRGRFSNGPTWAEDIGKTYQASDLLFTYKIYAVGGATAKFHEPDGRSFAPTTLNGEIEKFVSSSSMSSRSKTLAVIWVGGNDYFYNEDISDNEAAQHVVDAIVSGMKKLMDYGVNKFLILNLPDLSRIPQARIDGITERIQRQVQLHNVKLDEAVKTLRSKYPEVQIAYLDTYSIFMDVLDHTAQFNMEYGTHFTNIVDSCWHGGYMAAKNQKAQQVTANQEAAEAISNPNAALMHSMIKQSTELQVADNTDKLVSAGATRCTDEDDYLYWDNMHPTRVIHRVLAKIAMKEIAADIK